MLLLWTVVLVAVATLFAWPQLKIFRASLPPAGARLPPIAFERHWFWGHLFIVMHPERHLNVRRLVSKHGACFRLRGPVFWPVTSVVLVDGVAARFVLENFPKSPLYATLNVTTGGVPMTFTRPGLDGATLARRKHLAAVPAGETVDIDAAAMAVGLDMLSSVALGNFPFRAAEGGEPGATVLHGFPVMMHELLKNALKFWRRYLPLSLFPGRAKALRCRTDILSVAHRVIAHGRAAPPGSLDGTILGAIVSLPDVTDREMAAELMQFLIAGHETTAHTVRLQAELDVVLGAPVKGAPASVSHDQLSRCDFLHAVLKEAMRLFPVAADGMFRVAPTDTVLPGGWFVRKGTNIRIALFAAFTGAGFDGSFEKPLDFVPDRWLPPPGSPPGAPPPPAPPQFLPFSHGVRDCMGSTLALLQARLTLASLLHAFSFSRLPGAPPLESRTFLTLYPAGGNHCCVTQRG